MLIYAAHLNNIVLVRALLGLREKLNINHQNKVFYIELLRHRYLNFIFTQMGVTALMAAVHVQGFPTVEWIIKSRSDVNLQITDPKGRTALWQAASIGHVQMLQALIQAKASINSADEVRLLQLYGIFLKYLLN